MTKQRGFTLLELLIALAIGGIVVAGATSTLGHVIAGSAANSYHMRAVRQAQAAGYWVSHDAVMAQDVQLDDLTTPEAEFLVLNWAEWNGDTYKVVYTLEDTVDGFKQLQRQYTVTDSDGIETVTTAIVSQHIDDSAITDDDWDYNTEAKWNEDEDEKLVLRVTTSVTGKDETRIYEVSPRPISQ